MDKSILNQINSIKDEIKYFKKKIKEIDEDPAKIVVDTVKGSSKSYPYIQHNCIVEGVYNCKAIRNKKNRYKYKKLIRSKEFELEKLINSLEYELNYIEDKYSDIRQIIRYKYEDDMNWIQIMFKMGYETESKARMKLERFLKKL